MNSVLHKLSQLLIKSISTVFHQYLPPLGSILKEAVPVACGPAFTDIPVAISLRSVCTHTQHKNPSSSQSNAAYGHTVIRLPDSIYK